MKYFFEELDEGFIFLFYIIWVFEDGNMDSFLFYLEYKISNRKYLFLKLDWNGWNVMYFVVKGGNLRIF